MSEQRVFHRAAFDIDPQTLARLLQLPEDMSIVGFRWELHVDCLRICVEHPALPAQSVGSTCSVLRPRIISQDGTDTVRWEWQVPGLDNAEGEDAMSAARRMSARG